MFSNLLNKLKITVFLSLVGMATFANASLISIDSLDTGHYGQTNYHTPSNVNYIVYNFANQARNFAVFDLSQVHDTILSATIAYYNPASGFSSSNHSLTFELFDVDTNIEDILAGNSDSDVFNDLGTGVSYGNISVNGGSNDTELSISLNRDAIIALNNSNGLFAFGGAISNADEGMIFGNSHRNYQSNFVQLQLTTSTKVPTSGTFSLMILALVFMAFKRINNYKK